MDRCTSGRTRPAAQPRPRLCRSRPGRL